VCNEVLGSLDLKPSQRDSADFQKKVVFAVKAAQRRRRLRLSGFDSVQNEQSYHHYSYLCACFQNEIISFATFENFLVDVIALPRDRYPAGFVLALVPEVVFAIK
jgi:hypothetical protein